MTNYNEISKNLTHKTSCLTQNFYKASVLGLISFVSFKYFLQLSKYSIVNNLHCTEGQSFHP